MGKTIYRLRSSQIFITGWCEPPSNVFRLLVILFEWMSKNNWKSDKSIISLSKSIQLFIAFYSFYWPCFFKCEFDFVIIGKNHIVSLIAYKDQNKNSQKLCRICNNMGHAIFVIFESDYTNQWYHFHWFLLTIMLKFFCRQTDPTVRP